MPFIPHTEDDVRAMLETIGADSVAALFDEIPASLRCPPLEVPEGLNEAAVGRLMHARAAQDGFEVETSTALGSVEPCGDPDTVRVRTPRRDYGEVPLPFLEAVQDP